MATAVTKDIMQFDSKKVSREKQLQLYVDMLRPRMIEEKMLS